MYTPKIKEQLIYRLYKEARKLNKPMTKIVNGIIEEHFKTKCRNCLSECEIDEDSETAYCEFCESEVFVTR
jgi:hypothetical protein